MNDGEMGSARWRQEKRSSIGAAVSAPSLTNCRAAASRVVYSIKAAAAVGISIITHAEKTDSSAMIRQMMQLRWKVEDGKKEA